MIRFMVTSIYNYLAFLRLKASGFGWEDDPIHPKEHGILLTAGRLNDTTEEQTLCP